MSFSLFNSFNGNSQRLGQNYAIQSYDVVEPKGITFLSSDASSITFSFTPPVTSGSITGYQFSVNGQPVTGYGSPSAYTINGLNPGQQYSINVIANITTSSIANTTTTIFSPLAITGCCTWLDAADSSTVSLNGSGVSQWLDKSTNGFLFTQSTAGNQPIYSNNSLNNKNTLQFNGANSQYLGGPTNFAVGTNSYALFAVFRFSDTTSTGSVFNKSLAGQQNGRIIFIREGSTFNFRIADNVNANNYFSDTYSGNTYRVMVLIYNRTSGNGYIYNNGTVASTFSVDKTSNLTNSDNFIIGGYNNGSGTVSPPLSGYCLTGNIAEIIAFSNNYDMTTATQQQIEGYLAWKWGIQSYLPSGHPYFSSAPAGNSSSIVTTTKYQNIVSNPSRLLTNTTLAPFPTNIQLISATPTSLTFSFTAPTTGSTPTSYVPYVNGTSTAGSGTPSSYTISGLNAGTSYQVTMGANVTTTSSFTPTSISGCEIWFDAADTSTITYASGSNVSQWLDKSGSNNNAAQSTTTKQPTSGLLTTNGKNVMNFSAKSMTFPTINNTTMTVFCIYNNTTFSPYGQPVWVGPFAFFYAAPSSKVGIGRAGATDEVLASWSSAGLGTSQYVIYGGTVSVSGNTTTFLYFNGTQAATVSVNSSGGTSAYLIGDGIYNGTTGNIAEVLIYNSVLSTSDRQKVEGYLAWKWGLQTSLPGAHPYYSAAPSNTTTTIYQNPSPVSFTTPLPFAIPSGITGGAPTIYYPFWTDTKDYATGTGISDATFNGAIPPSLSSSATYRSYAQNALYSSNTSCNMLLPVTTINTSIGFTVCVWIYLTSTTNGMIWSVNSSVKSTRAFLYMYGSTLRIYVGTVGNASNDYALNKNTWYFVTFVQPPNGVPYVSFNNGTTTNLTNYAAVNFTSSYHYIFGDPALGSSSGGTIGYINNFYLFNRVLSASEITALYNQ